MESLFEPYHCSHRSQRLAGISDSSWLHYANTTISQIIGKRTGSTDRCLFNREASVARVDVFDLVPRRSFESKTGTDTRRARRRNVEAMAPPEVVDTGSAM